MKIDFVTVALVVFLIVLIPVVWKLVFRDDVFCHYKVHMEFAKRSDSIFLNNDRLEKGFTECCSAKFNNDHEYVDDRCVIFNRSAEIP